MSNPIGFLFSLSLLQQTFLSSHTSTRVFILLRTWIQEIFLSSVQSGPEDSHIPNTMSIKYTCCVFLLLPIIRQSSFTQTLRIEKERLTLFSFFLTVVDFHNRKLRPPIQVSSTRAESQDPCFNPGHLPFFFAVMSQECVDLQLNSLSEFKRTLSREQNRECSEEERA